MGKAVYMPRFLSHIVTDTAIAHMWQKNSSHGDSFYTCGTFLLPCPPILKINEFQSNRQTHTTHLWMVIKSNNIEAQWNASPLKKYREQPVCSGTAAQLLLRAQYIGWPVDNDIVTPVHEWQFLSECLKAYRMTTEMLRMHRGTVAESNLLKKLQ